MFVYFKMKRKYVRELERALLLLFMSGLFLVMFIYQTVVDSNEWLFVMSGSLFIIFLFFALNASFRFVIYQHAR